MLMLGRLTALVILCELVLSDPFHPANAPKGQKEKKTSWILDSQTQCLANEEEEKNSPCASLISHLHLSGGGAPDFPPESPSLLLEG